jgi:hypothetical protein
MKSQVSHRLDDELLSWATEYGSSRGTSRAVVIEEALRHFRELTRGGVPDLPVVDTPAVREQRAGASKLERAKQAAPVRPARELSRPSGDVVARQERLNAAAARARAK